MFKTVYREHYLLYLKHSTPPTIIHLHLGKIYPLLVMITIVRSIFLYQTEDALTLHFVFSCRQLNTFDQGVQNIWHEEKDPSAEGNGFLPRKALHKPTLIFWLQSSEPMLDCLALIWFNCVFFWKFFSDWWSWANAVSRPDTQNYQHRSDLACGQQHKWHPPSPCLFLLLDWQSYLAMKLLTTLALDTPTWKKNLLLLILWWMAVSPFCRWGLMYVHITVTCQSLPAEFKEEAKFDPELLDL